MAINMFMKLEEVWSLIETINNAANQMSKDLWTSNNVNDAIDYQTTCFRQKFLELDKRQQQAIQRWTERDAELHDYFNLLSNNMIVDCVSKC